MSRGDGSGDRREVMTVTVIRITQVTFTEAGVVVGGEPVDDPTKVVVAAVSNPLEAIPLALAVAAGITPEVEPPDDAIVSIIEKPKSDI
jgi:hypothetical protein